MKSYQKDLEEIRLESQRILKDGKNEYFKDNESHVYNFQLAVVKEKNANCYLVEFHQNIFQNPMSHIHIPLFNFKSKKCFSHPILIGFYYKTFDGPGKEN